MDVLIIILVIIVLIPLIYLLYFFSNSGILTEDEIMELSASKRFWDIFNYYGFVGTQLEVNKEFKSALNKKGQFYNCNENINKFPAIASALLKSKKHEWVIFAFAKDKNVFSFYTNKGSNNQSVVPSISSDYLSNLANDKGAEIVLQFHNHPNAVLSASPQDLTSAKYFGEMFTNKAINYVSFVCGAGHFHQYGWWMSNSFYNVNNYVEEIQTQNGISRSKNFELRKELKKRKYFKDSRLNNSSHNMNIQNNYAKPEEIILMNSVKKEIPMDYLQNVLEQFQDDLKSYPGPNCTKVENMENMGDNKNETWNKYYYDLEQKEFGIFENLELIDHSENHKSFIFWTNTFSLNDIKHIVSIFYNIFGADSIGKGMFDDKDRNEITQQKFWMGRMWSDYEKYKCAVLISFDYSGPKLDLCLKW